ncbi:hypothetical protein LZ009_00025 [Ramlibacter sp. XY19]|uniref:hypothetical protein n=1 Tax=Ramlibacter paludis TaxID=2908000 RepID=UPI0023D9C51C|nr:hypothetical protein [Ramlibacter paludis]MCG2591162.1 hypothetical protein [Ramlibacter paludis]
MGQRIDYLEESPEDNAANYVNGRFDPKAAEERRAAQLRQFEIQAKLGAEARTMAQRHRPQTKGHR